MLESPELDSRAKAALLEQVLGDADELVRNFIRLLAEKGRAGELHEIAREFEALVAQDQGFSTSSSPPRSSSSRIRELVARVGRASGRKVRASRVVDPDLVGGLVLQIGSRRLDASIRGRLERLRQELTTRRSTA